MRKIVLLLTIAALLVGCAADIAPDSNPNPNPNPDPAADEILPAPGFALQDLAGNTWSLEELEGEVVVLYFWTASCPNCIKKLPELSSLQEELPEDVNLLLLNGGDSKQRIEEVIEDYPNLTVLTNAADIFGRYGVRYVPTTVFIDGQGQVDRGFIGPIPNQAMLQIIQELR